jgi:hypothetical protein
MLVIGDFHHHHHHPASCLQHVAKCCKMLEDIFQTTNRSMVQPEGTMPGKGVV